MPGSVPKCVRTIPLGTHLQLACWLRVANRGVWFLALCLQALSDAARHPVPDPPTKEARNPLCLSTHAGTGKLPSRMECWVDLQASARTRAADAVGCRLWIMDKQNNLPNLPSRPVHSPWWRSSTQGHPTPEASLLMSITSCDWYWVDLHASTKTPPQPCVMPPTKVFGSFRLNHPGDVISSRRRAMHQQQP